MLPKAQPLFYQVRLFYGIHDADPAGRCLCISSGTGNCGWNGDWRFYNVYCRGNNLFERAARMYGKFCGGKSIWAILSSDEGIPKHAGYHAAEPKAAGAQWGA